MPSWPAMSRQTAQIRRRNRQPGKITAHRTAGLRYRQASESGRDTYLNLTSLAQMRSAFVAFPSRLLRAGNKGLEPAAQHGRLASISNFAEREQWYRPGRVFFQA